MFSQGDLVRKKSDAGTTGTVVGGPTARPGGSAWKVRQSDGSVTFWREKSMEAVPEECDVKSELVADRFGTSEDFRQFMTYQRLATPLRDNLYSMSSTKTDFYPHQFKPLLKLLDNPRPRMLIADEVGLGKTIEAGLILTEWKARGAVSRVLVVCPASLREKWRWELKHRFGDEFTIYRSRRELKDYLERWEESGRTMPFFGIVSLQGLRMPALRALFEESEFSFDMVIIDEAHHMRNTGTLSNQLGGVLAEMADCMLMLTATPVNLGTPDLYHLLSVLDEDSFNDPYVFDQFLDCNKHILGAQAALRPGKEDLQTCRTCLRNLDGHRLFAENPMWKRVRGKIETGAPASAEEYVRLRRDIGELNLLGRSLTRTRKSEVIQQGVKRHAVVREVVFSEEECHLYEQITEFVLRQYSYVDQPGFAGFILMMPQRQAASCLPAMVERYSIDYDSDFEGLDPPDIDELGTEKNDKGDELKTRIQDGVADILSRTPPLPTDSKYLALAEFLHGRSKANEKALLFSTFKGTLRYLERRLREDGIRVEIVHGDIDPDERIRRVERFRDREDTNLLLTSEVSSEGLDFQFCSTLINYDLPWNPMVVEQRIGRLDRLGQESKVITIVNFSIPGTIEERILRRLYMRIRIFEHSIGMLEGILGDIVKEFTHEVLSGKLDREEEEELFARTSQAVINRQKEQEQLELQSPTFLGLDDFLGAEIERIRAQGRFIGPEELQNLVMGFIDVYYPRTRFERLPKYSDNTCRLHVDDGLRQKLARHQLKPGQLPPSALLAPSRPCTVTFDPDVATNHAECEFVNVNHPLVDVVRETYAADLSKFPKAVYLDLRSDAVLPGIYMFLISRLAIRGVTDEVRLHCTAIDLESGNLPSQQAMESLFSAMLHQGKNPSRKSKIPECDRASNYARLQEEFNTWGEAVFSDADNRNAALISLKVASVKAFYRKRIERQHELRTKYLSAGKSSLAKGAETRAQNLSVQCDHKVGDLENRMEIDPETSELIGGVVNVCAT